MKHQPSIGIGISMNVHSGISIGIGMVVSVEHYVGLCTCLVLVSVWFRIVWLGLGFSDCSSLLSGLIDIKV